MDDFDKTIPRRDRENDSYDTDRTIPGARARKQDGSFNAGYLILDRYKVLSELGQGGMGVVYKCFDITGGIEIALKALPPELSHNTIEMEDIKDNFQLVSKLVHQNIAISKNLEKDNATGNYYLIMECVEGEDLRRWIKRKRKDNALTLEAVLPVIRQVAAALDYAHEEKIIHRDIKPGNIMIDAAGHVKVLDFGLAAQIHTSMTRVSMAYRGTSGTGPYMAPEQWRGKIQTATADQYALAVMAYEMLAGHLPFESSDAAVLQQAVLTQDADPIDGIPKHAQTALRRAMSKDSESRFETCGDFAAALGGQKVSGAKRKQNKGAWWFSAVAAAVILLGGAGFVWHTELQEKVQGFYAAANNRKILDKWNNEAKYAQEMKDWNRVKECAENIRPYDAARADALVVLAAEGTRNQIVSSLLEKAAKASMNKQWEDLKEICRQIQEQDASNKKASLFYAEAERQLQIVADNQKYEKELSEKATRGYEIVEQNGKKTAVWRKGKTHSENSWLTSSSKEGEWECTKPGYVWAGGTSIRWKKGLKHPEKSDLISGTTEGTWECTTPGYVWVSGITTEWKAGLKSDLYPHWETIDKKEYWHPEDGYVKEDPKEEGLTKLIWKPNLLSRDGKRKTTNTEGVWLNKTTCSGCNGAGIVLSTSKCTTCNGKAIIQKTTDCTHCSNGREGIREITCSYCNRNGRVRVPCPDCGAITMNGSVVCQHGQICDMCRGSGAVQWQPRNSNTLGDLFTNLGEALQAGAQGNLVRCSKCNGFGYYTHSTCSGTGQLVQECSYCNGNGKTLFIESCTYCGGKGEITTTERCPDCNNGIASSVSDCSLCHGDGYVWK